jgi:hypothetical protein
MIPPPAGKTDWTAAVLVSKLELLTLKSPVEHWPLALIML